MAPEADAGRPYTLVDDRLWFVDTGASRTTCDDDFVASLGVKARPTLLRAHGEVGSVPIRLAVLRDVTIGGWTFRRLPCAVRDLATTSSLPDDPDEPVAGILGANLFRAFVVDLDFARGRLHLREDVPTGFADGVVLRRERTVGPRLLAPLEVDGERVDVVIDTGADRTYLPLESGEEVARYAAERQGTGPGGATAVEVVIRAVDHARIAGRPVPLRRYVYRRGRPGLLGMDALGVSRVVLDARARRLAWEDGPTPSFPPPDEARRTASGSEIERAGGE